MRTHEVARRSSWLPWAILGWALVANVLATWAVHRAITTQTRATVAEAASAEQHRMAGRIDLYVAMLRGVSGLFQAIGEISPTHLRTYLTRLRLTELYPGIQGVGLTVSFPTAERDRVEAHWRTVHPDFHVWPEPSGPTATAIVLLEPQDARNRVALGFDMSSEPTRAEAMRRAVDDGYARATGRVTLVQEIDTHKQAGFLVYVPVYAAQGVPATREERWRTLRGYAYAPFRVDDLIESLGVPLASRLAVDIYDGPEVADTHLLHRSPNGGAGHLTETRTIDIAGRTWTLVFTLAEPESLGVRLLAPLVAAVGVLLSLLLFWGARRQVAAERAQRDLRRTAEAERERAEQAVELRERLMAIIGHDLRTPLSAVMMGASLLEQRVTASDAVPTVQRVKRSAERMSRMIEQLLDFARLRQGQPLSLERAPHDVAHVARTIVDELRLAHTGREIHLECEGDTHASIDADRLGQVLANLVGNALQHGAGTPVQVTVHGGERVDVSVRNGGPAIPPDLQEAIFEPFARGGGGGSRRLGLGLYISREIVRAHGGELVVRSSDAEGTELSFALPRT